LPDNEEQQIHQKIAMTALVKLCVKQLDYNKQALFAFLTLLDRHVIEKPHKQQINSNDCLE
jgi:hypothetical protein